MTTHPAALPDPELLSQCQMRFGRASGPGGQHRNKVETEVSLMHRPTGISARASERRSQSENKGVALSRLRFLLAIEVRQPAPPGPSALWVSRRKGTTIRCNPAHADFPVLIAEIFDVLAENEWEAPPTGRHFGVTPTQIVRLVADHPAAFVRWNAERKARGLGPLHS